MTEPRKAAWILLGASLLAMLPGTAHADAGTEAGTDAGNTICPTTVLEGVDVYQGNGTVDWAQVADAGRSFAFIKATQGDYNTSAVFAASWSGALVAGVVRSPYHYFDATIDGVAQANHFLAVLQAAGGLQTGDLPPALDLECPTTSSADAAANYCLGNGTSGWAAPSVVAQRAFDWLRTVEQATGRVPIIATYTSWPADVGVTDPALAAHPLWIFSPGACASVPAPWTTASFWLYSVHGTVPGISGFSTDEDRFLGTTSDLAAFVDASVIPDAGPDADAGDNDSAQADAMDSGDDTADANDDVVDAADAADAADEGADAADATNREVDATVADATIADAGPSDAAPDAEEGGRGGSDAGARSGSKSGCGCGVGGTAEGAAWSLLLAAVVLARRLARGSRRPVL